MQAKKLFTLACIFITSQLCGLSSNSYYDPFPVYTSLDPHTFLHTREKQYVKGYPRDVRHYERAGLYLSAFGQNADKARTAQNTEVELGDIGGRWNMIGLLFGDFPKNVIEFPSASLNDAFDKIFSQITADGINVQEFIPGTLNDTHFIDKGQTFGFFENVLRYRKRGFRWEFNVQMLKDIGFSFQGGVADICHELKEMKNLTCDDPTGCCLIKEAGDFTVDNVNNCLMCNVKQIADELCLKICSFHEVSIEDVRMRLYWRHIIDINKYHDNWPDVLVIPFITVGGSIATGKDRDPNHMFALSFGSDDHHSVGTTFGINVDFMDTVEVGGEFGFTHFFKRNLNCMPTPTSLCQSGIFPFKTDVNIEPGHNWHFGLKMSAHHFLDKLSGYFQYLILQHENDTITVKNCDCAFKPEVLEKNTTFKVQMANIGFTYDISPHISLGFLWQAPLARRNAYRSSTIMFSFNATY